MVCEPGPFEGLGSGPVTARVTQGHCECGPLAEPSLKSVWAGTLEAQQHLLLKPVVMLLTSRSHEASVLT